MSTIGTVSGNSAYYYQKQKEMFSKTDADSDGKVTQSEFVSARPSDVTEEQATSLYSSIDTEGTGSISLEQFSAAHQAPESKVSGDAMDVLMQMAPQGGMMPPGGGEAQDSAEIFDELDTNQDGSVSEAEFLAGKPEDMSEEQATALFDSIDTEGTGSITEEQLADSMEQGAGGPPMGPPPGGFDMAALESLLSTSTETTSGTSAV